MSEHNSTGANENDLDAAVAIANQYANTILLALRTVHEYIVPRAASHGIKLSARETHAWAVSLSISLSQSKTHYRMPATRLERPARAQKKAAARSIQSPKTELFPRTEQPMAAAREFVAPFSTHGVAPALRKLRQMLRRDAIDEGELLSILRESTPQDAVAPESLEEAPTRSLELLLARWSVVRELVEAGRRDGGEAA